jgi:hypothetical protein
MFRFNQERTMKRLWGLMALLLLAGCNEPTATSTVTGQMAVAGQKPVAAPPTRPPLIQALADFHSDGELIALIQSGADLNTPGELGLTPFTALVAQRSPAVVQAAIAAGGDVQASVGGLDVVGIVKQVHGLTDPAELTLHKGAFTLHGAAKLAPNPRPLAELTPLVEKVALIRSRQWALQQQQNDAPLKKVRSEFATWRKTSEALIAELSRPIPSIPKPELPALERHEKSPFETLAMFQQRMEQAKLAREAQVSQLMADYRKQVEARNKKVAKVTAELEALQAEIPKRNAALAKAEQELIDRIAREQKQRERIFIAEAVAEIYGAPYLQAISVDGQPKYDAEKGLMFATLGFANLAETHEVTLAVPPGDSAATFYAALKQGELHPAVRFDFAAKGNGMTMTSAEVKLNSKNYLARLDNNQEFIAQAPLQVVLQNRDQLPPLEQMAPVRFDDTALRQLALQNPNLKDVQFEAFLIQEQQAFDDDLPNRLLNASAATIDKSKWLFVIGIGSYQSTDNILYARRSAELFAQVASKRLGIDPSRTTLLLDGDATSGRIQDELRLMLSKVAKGDRIYFYYAGHGLPVPEQGNAPYLLPADKIPDFVADDKFYSAEQIYRLLTESHASQVIAFMDSCFTGQTDGKSVFGGTKAATRLQPKRTAINSNKIAILTAGNDKQYASALPERGHRLFSYFVMDELIAGADTIGTLAGRVTKKVDSKSLDLGGSNRQTPVLAGNGKLTL